MKEVVLLACGKELKVKFPSVVILIMKEVVLLDNPLRVWTCMHVS